MLEEPDALDLMTVLLHDKLEDLTQANYEPVRWKALEARFRQKPRK